MRQTYLVEIKQSIHIEVCKIINEVPAERPYIKNRTGTEAIKAMGMNENKIFLRKPE